MDDPQPGERLGRYVLRHEIGRGAMGTVWAAIDPELDRNVAIKLLHWDAARDRSRDGFLREARATARLNHRNVVKIHDVGIVGSSSRLFLAMELVDGPTLRVWLQTPRSWREVLAAVLDAGAGLAAAHDAGIVHRDFKPDNVLLDAAVGRVVVTDFGLAHRPEDPSTLDVEAPSTRPMLLDATVDGTFQGTAAYAAPEQLYGERSDARSDQFAFCVTLYEALWGARPFDGESVDALLEAIAAGPSRVDDRPVPPWLRRVVLRGLAPLAVDRFPDMHALLVALDPRRRSRTAAIVASSLGVAAIAGVALLPGAAQDPQSYCDRVGQRMVGVWDDEVRHAVEAAFVATHEPAARDTWLAMSSQLDTFAERWVAVRTEVCHAGESGSLDAEAFRLRTTCLDRQLERAAALTATLSTVESVNVLNARDGVANIGAPEVCMQERRLVRGAAARAAIPLQVQREIDELLDLAEVLNDTAEYARAEQVGRDGLARAVEVGDGWSEAKAWMIIAISQQWQQSATSEASYHEALNASLRVGHERFGALAIIGLLELWSPETEGGVVGAQQWEQHCNALLSAYGGDINVELELRVAVGNVYLKAGRYDEAKAAYERALALRRGAEDNRLLAGAQANLGAIAAAHGHYAEALERFRWAYDALVVVYGPHHPGVAAGAINLGSAMAELGDLEGARDVHLGALRVLESNFGPDHPSLAPALRMLAWNGLSRREFAEALPYAERALAIARSDADEGGESIARGLGMVASIEVELGRFARARELSAQALVLARQSLGSEHPTVAEFETDCGIAESGTHNDDVAREHFARAIALRERTLGPDDGEIGRAWSGLAELELARGHTQAAIEAATKAVAIATRPGNERGGVGPEAAFLLARALMSGGDARERARARELATQANVDLAATGPGWQRRADEIAAWLATARLD